MSFAALIKNILPTGKLFRDVATLAGGTAAAQLMLIFASPILTRLFSPSDFGVLAVFASVVGILSVVVSWRYEFAIPIAKSDEEAVNLLALSILLSVLTSIVVAIAGLIEGKQFVQWSNAPELSSYVWLIPLVLLAFGIFQAINYWLTRKKTFTYIGVAKVVQSAVQVGVQLVTGAISLGAVGLVVGHVLGRMASATYLLFRSRLDFRMLSVQGISLVGRRYKKFPLYTAWASLINVLGTQAPMIMFAKLFSTEVAGLFSLTIRILSLPAALIGQAVGQALYPRLAEKVKGSGTASRMIGDAALLLLIVSFPVFVFLGASGPLLFSLIFGPEWQQGGVYARYLSPWLLLSFISSPLSMFAFVKAQQGVAFIITIYETTLRISSIYVGSIYNSPNIAVLLYAIVGAVVSFVYIVWVFSLAKLSVFSWVSQHKSYFLSIVFVGVLLSLVAALGKSYLTLGVSAVVLSLHFSLWIHRYRGLLYA